MRNFFLKSHIFIQEKTHQERFERRPSINDSTNESLVTRRRLSSTVGLEEETRETGVVRWPVYKTYWFAVGNLLSISILLSLILMQATRNYADIYLAKWVDANAEKINESNMPNGTAFGYHSTVRQYLSMYGGIAVANSMFSLFRAFLFAYGGITAARKLHQRLLAVILRARTWFFDTTPLGRIVNRFRY